MREHSIVNKHSCAMLYDLGNNTIVTIELFEASYGRHELYVVREVTTKKPLLSAITYTGGKCARLLYLYCPQGLELQEEFVKYLIEYKRVSVDRILVDKHMVSPEFVRDHDLVESIYENESNMLVYGNWL